MDYILLIFLILDLLWVLWFFYPYAFLASLGGAAWMATDIRGEHDLREDIKIIIGVFLLIVSLLYFVIFLIKY